MKKVHWTVTGGAIKNPLWTSILADVLQQPLHVHDEREGPAYGAAILAGFGSGIWKDLSDLAILYTQLEIIGFRVENKDVYDRQFTRYQTIAQTINPLF